MGNWWVYLLFAATCALGVLIAARANRKYMNYYENNMTKEPEEKAESPKDIWKKEGCSRSFENAEYTLPEEDFFENEKTEFPQTEEELFSGISEEEKQSILKEAGLLEDEDGRE